MVLITQSAGARAKFGIPWGGNMGLTYYQAYSSDGLSTRSIRPEFSALTCPFFSRTGLTWSAVGLRATVWSRMALLSTHDVDYLNTAWDAKVRYRLW